MRNLQKILALVLALVMSLSLMATAGATDFTDADQINEIFEESVNVLDGLKVFQGYPSGDFQPKGEITRAEVAAIIYRIATGDVDDAQVGIYADYNKFSDVYASEPMSGWAAGYINYCANAEYVKGRGNGKFDPAGKVTGYEALAMILRAVGYDKNGEFTGADWAVQTAAIANQRHVTDNISAGLLGEPATREMVAEILCKSILLNTVNYTLAYGYQISTNPQDTIAYKTFKMEQVEGVVTGNEIADLESESPMAAGQTRLVVDGEKKTMNFTTGLESIGKSVRAYIRPQSGTTVKELVSGKTYDTDKNHVYDSFAKVDSVGNSTGKDNGITSIEGAEHYINYDYVTRWTARMRITYVMDLKWTEYQAFSMRRDNGGKLYTYQKTNLVPNSDDEITLAMIGTDRSAWDTRLPYDDYTYTYVKTIELEDELTQQDWDNLLSIFTKADKTTGVIMGEVYVGTASFDAQKDISDDIRWEDFTATYLKNETTRKQVESNGLGNRLIIIDNDDDGIAEYVLQTIYTIAKVVPNGTAKTLSAVEIKFNDTNDRVNIVSASNDLVSVSGKELAASEDELNVEDVVIYALIDGNLRAQKAESASGRVTAINRAATTATLDNEIGEKKQSAVHQHADGLGSGVANMVIGTNYTVYYDLDGNLAAYTEGNVGSFVLITDGWYNQAVNAREYAVQAFIDGRLQTVNVTNNGSLFVNNATSNNAWGRLSHGFGNGLINSANTNGNAVQTIVANLEDGNLIPVDKSYYYSQQARMLDMINNAIPTRDGNARGNVYTTTYGLNNIAYNDTVDNNGGNGYEVLGRSDTVYYYVHNIGKTVNGQNNYVVRTYTGYNNIPAVDPSYIEDVYTVGIRNGATTATSTNATYYTAEIVVVELNEKYLDSRITSEQVFIPSTGFVSGSIQGAGLEQVEMIRGNGAVETVWVDMRQSDVRGYNLTASSSATTTSHAGLYFMDPIGTTADGEVTYKIEWMDRTHIRANNYLAGYVSQTNVTNDHIRVDMQVPGTINGIESPVDVLNTEPNNNIYWRQGASITANSKLYKLGYSSTGVHTLNGDLTAAEVFYRNPDPNVSNTDPVTTNELWDRNTGLFNLNPRNEVLVRYDDNGNVIWAISFREFRSGSTRDDFAQSAWWKCLPAAKDQTNDEETPTTFLGAGLNSTRNLVAAADRGVGTKENPYRITLSHLDAVQAAKDNKLIDVTSVSGTVVTYKLEKWNGINWIEIDRNQIDNENIDVAGQVRYQLTITLNQGEPIVYLLVKNAAQEDAELLMDGNKLAGNEITLPATPESLNYFFGRFGATNNGRIAWEVTLDGTTYQFTSFNGETGMAEAINKATGLPATIDTNKYKTNNIKALVATIYNEDGKTVSAKLPNAYYGAQSTADATEVAQEATKGSIAAAAGYDANTASAAAKAAYNTIANKIENMTLAQVQAYMNSAEHQNDVANLKAAMTNSAKTWLKLGTITPFTGASLNNVNLSTTIPVEGAANVTLSVVGGTDNKTYKFTATSAGKTIPATANVVCGAAPLAASYAVTFEGLTAGEWTIDCEEVKTAPVEVEFTWTGSQTGTVTATVNGQDTVVPTSTNVVPGDDLVFTVTPVGTDGVISVKESGTDVPMKDGKYVYSLPISADTKKTITITVAPKATSIEANKTAETKDTVTYSLSGAVTLAAPFVTPAGKTAIVELNGNTVSCAAGPAFRVDGGNLQLTGNGTVRNTSTDNSLTGSAVLVSGNGGNLEITGVNGKINLSGIWGVSVNKDIAKPVNIDITDAVITGRDCGVYVNGLNKNANMINITDTDMTVEQTGVYVPAGDTTVNITRGLIISTKSSAVEARGGEVHLVNANLTSEHTSYAAVATPTGGGARVDGAALVIDPYGDRAVVVTATGGTFTTKDSTCVVVAQLDEANTAGSKLELTGVTGVAANNIKYVKGSVENFNGTVTLNGTVQTPTFANP